MDCDSRQIGRAASTAKHGVKRNDLTEAVTSYIRQKNVPLGSQCKQKKAQNFVFPSSFLYCRIADTWK
jgi:hypothetical protein